MAQPVVGLPEVVEDDAAAVAAARREHDGGGGVGLAGHPGGVEGVGDQEEGHDQDHPAGHLADRGDMKGGMMELGCGILTMPCPFMENKAFVKRYL